MTVLLKRCFSSATKAAAKIITSPDKLVYPSMPSHQYILEGVEQYLDRVLLIDGVTKAEVTGATLAAQVGRMANKFKSAGMGRGDHVAVVGLNHLNYLPAKLGVIATGAVPVLFNPMYNVQELSKLLNVSECNFAIGHMCSNANLEAVKDKHNLKILPHLEVLDEWAKDESSICPEFPGSMDDTSLMMFSSGTTGLPKSVELTHDNLNSQLASLEVTTNLATLVKELPDAVPTIVDFLPEFHTYGSLLAQYTVRSGYKRVSLPFFTPEMYLQCLQDHKAHGTTVVPPIMLMLQKLPIVPEYDLSSLRLIIVGAAPLAPETEQAVQERLMGCNEGMNLRIIQGYGCTETSGASMVGRVEADYKAGTVGRVVAGQEIKLVNSDTGELCGPNERGEIFIRGPQIMKGYYKNDAANAESFDGEWLRTGDIAYYDNEEDFFIVDRLKEFIKVKGFQVAPAELEAVLIAHDQISDAAVIGIADDRCGEVPKAYVVLPYGVKLTEDDIKAYVRSQVSDYKELGAVEFVKTIPKLPSGKIQRRLLREKHEKTTKAAK